MPRDESGRRQLVPLGNNREEAIAKALGKSDRRNEVEYRDTLYERIKKNSRHRNIPCHLTRKDIDVIFERSGGRCEVSGIPFEYNKTKGLRARPWIPSVDRVNTRGPYSLDNCRLVCAYINMALNEFGLETLLFVSKNVIYYATTNAVGIEEVTHENKMQRLDGEVNSNNGEVNCS